MLAGFLFVYKIQTLSMGRMFCCLSQQSTLPDQDSIIHSLTHYFIFTYLISNAKPITLLSTYTHLSLGKHLFTMKATINTTTILMLLATITTAVAAPVGSTPSLSRRYEDTAAAVDAVAATCTQPITTRAPLLDLLKGLPLVGGLLGSLHDCHEAASDLASSSSPSP